MQIKRYEAKNVQEALDKIKRELGPDAVILSSKQLSGGKAPRVEVVAAKDSGETQALRPFPARHYGETVPSPAVVPPLGEKPEWDALKEDVGELKVLLRELKKRDEIFDEFGEVKERLNVLFDLLGLKDKGEKNPLAQVYSRLVAQGVSRKSACILLEMLKRGAMTDHFGTSDEAMKCVENLIRSRFRRKQAAEADSRIKVFVGPTGVGKTTTIAKLAAHYALGGKKRVGLATTDTYRIAAPEQLKTYAKIMGIPVQVASDTTCLHKVIEDFADRDVILIDTPGTGLNDLSHFERTKDMFADRDGLEMSLLLSLASSRENLFDTFSRFEDLRIDQVILTKMDECRRFGFLFDLMEKARKPVSYVTTGQNVPQDIAEVTSGNLAKLIVEGVLN